MRILTALVMLAVATTTAGAQTQFPPAGQSGAACPPDAAPNSPTVGSGDRSNLSDKLAQSKGVICPPAGHDSEMTIQPPNTGTMPVIPPPGSPGGDQSVQPK